MTLHGAFAFERTLQPAVRVHDQSFCGWRNLRHSAKEDASDTTSVPEALTGAAIFSLKSKSNPLSLKTSGVAIGGTSP